VKEAAWESSSDLAGMLAHLREDASDRKLRLFACACCRRVWHLLTDERSRYAVEVAERYADERADFAELRAAAPADILAGDAAHSAAESHLWAYRGYSDAAFRAAQAAAGAAGAPWSSAWETAQKAEVAAQCRLLREIFGNPFRPIPVAPAVRAWRDGTVVRLAQAAYEERRLPSGLLDDARRSILADALEEAGGEPQIIGHLRSGEEHVRGYWVVDLILSKDR
jgi:hypothetical protein